MNFKNYRQPHIFNLLYSYSNSACYFAVFFSQNSACCVTMTLIKGKFQVFFIISIYALINVKPELGRPSMHGAFDTERLSMVGKFDRVRLPRVEIFDSWFLGREEKKTREET